MTGLKRCFTAVLCLLMLVGATGGSAGAESGDALYLLDSGKENGRLQIVMTLISDQTPEADDVRVSFSGIGASGYQFYPSDNLQKGYSLCIVPDVASTTDGRAMRDMQTIVGKLLDGLGEDDNACILSEDSNALSKDRDALKKQLAALPAATKNRYDQIGAAIELLTTSEERALRSCIVILSDGFGAGEMPDDLAARIDAARIPVFAVTMLYGSGNFARIADEEDLTKLAEGSRGGAAFKLGIASKTVLAAAEGIQALRGTGYVMELDADGVRKQVNELGDTVKIEIDTASGTLSDTLELSAADIPGGANDPISVGPQITPKPSAEATPTPDASGQPQATPTPGTPDPGTTAQPGDTPAPSDSADPIVTATPAATATPADSANPAETPAPTDAAAVAAIDATPPAEGAPTDGDEAEKSGPLAWYAALPLLWKIGIPAGAALIIAGVILLILLQKKRRKKALGADVAPAEDGFCAAEAHANSNSVVIAAPDECTRPGDAAPSGASAASGNAARLCLVRLSEAGETKLELELHGSLTVGRDAGCCQLVIDDDPEIADTDCRFELRGGRLYVCDLTAADDPGTAVVSGDTAQIGGFFYRVFWAV